MCLSSFYLFIYFIKPEILVPSTPIGYNDFSKVRNPGKRNLTFLSIPTKVPFFLIRNINMSITKRISTL